MTVSLKEKRRESATPLLDGEKLAVGKTVASTDWLGRPADDRHDLGGWSCAVCMIGAYFLVNSAFYGIIGNLVLYLVDEWDESNSAASANVTNLIGTSLFCSCIGSFISDGYMGRFWGSVVFVTLTFFSFVSLSLVGTRVDYSQSSQVTVSWTVVLGFFYLMAISSGSTFPSVCSLGADQLPSQKQKATFFTLIAMTVNAGQIFACTAISFVDGKELWDLGFWLCTGAAGAALVLTLSTANKYRIYRAAGNPLARVVQVVVSALRNRNASIPEHARLLHEVEGDMSAIPGCRKLVHTGALRCLDKAAVRTDGNMSASPWRLCTVTQVEEVKSLMQVLPVGLASTCLMTGVAQVTSLFQVQAAATSGKLVGGLSIEPASMQLFYISGALFTGCVSYTVGVCPSNEQRRCFGNYRPTSLQLQGVAMLVASVAMVVAGLVETHRLHVANAGGELISLTWLIPQNFILGVAVNLLYSGRFDFFYNEVSDGTRSVSLALSFFFSGLSYYLDSIFVYLVTVITTRDGSLGWIPDDINDGHLDYFYWFLASFLILSLGLYLLYTYFYTYREARDNSTESLS